MQEWMIVVALASFLAGVLYYYLRTSSVPLWAALGTLVVILVSIPGDPAGFNLLKYVFMIPAVVIGFNLTYQFEKRRRRSH